MSNSSDDSDVDLDEMAKMVEDLNDLDSGLLKSKNSDAKSAKAKETQKKVVFQVFDDDNSLDDLLSEGIDSSKNSKPLLSDAKASKVADLFRIEPAESKSTLNTTNTASSFLESSGSLRATQKDYSVEKTEKRPSLEKTISIDPARSLESFENITDNPLPKAPDRARKSSLMEDLFGSKSRASSLRDVSKNQPRRHFEEEMTTESMPNLQEKEVGPKSAGGFTLTSASVREPRRGRSRSTVLDDPLGLLGSSSVVQDPQPTEVKKKVEAVKSNQDDSQDDLPEWLGGTKKSEKPGESKSSHSQKETSNLDFVAKSEKKTSHSDVAQLAEMDFEQQAALIALQQQEHELRTATTLSQQTEHLNSIIERQKSQLNEQEKMFNMLVKRQVERQAALDMEIKMQQAKIDRYIQVLAKQPTGPLPSSHSEGKDFSVQREEKLKEDVKIESESLINRLEVEKLNLENIVHILKEKHQTEIKILEDSHETQMHFMRSSMERLETKLRENTETLERDYEKKIEKLVNEKNQLEEFFKEQISHLKEEHKETISELHTRHTEQIALLQREHAETIENISRAKELERQTVDFLKSNQNNLETVLDKSKVIFDNFQNISDQLKNRDTHINDKKENYLIKQEEQLQVLRVQLNLQQESLENERKQLTIAAHNLKTETSQLSQQFQKNTELYNETEARLKMREIALTKERELFLEQSKWERDHLQYLKEAWISEQKRQMHQLAAEREAVVAEKAKLEVFHYLKSNSDDITKVELEAAIKAAHEATESANLEKKRWQEKINSYEADKERIKLKEKHLMERAKELEDLTQSAILKRDEGLRALREAQRLEKQHKDRISQLEMQLELLAQQENKIAAEKLSLARDRLAVKIHHEKPERDVTSRSFHSQTHQPFYLSQMQTHFKDVVDPQLLLLKLNLDNKLDTSNQLITDMQTVN